MDTAARWEEVVERGGGSVTQHGTVAAREHRGHPAAALRQARVADGVDASVNAVEATGVNAVVDRLATKAKGKELWIRNNSVLPPGQRRDQRVDRSSAYFFPHSE